MPNFLAGSPTPIGSPTGTLQFPQQFRTIPVINLQLATYQLQIRDSNGNLVSSYIFPLSPQHVRKTFSSLSNFYDVQGDQTNNGVQRVFDIYGNTPVSFILEGTTGWKYHSSDGYTYTGLQSISQLESFLSSFATLNQQQIINNNPNLYELWFFDYFRNNYWSVVPIGEQTVRQSETRPLFVYYSFRLAGLRDLSAPAPAVPDPLMQTLDTSPAQSSQIVQTFGTNIASQYSSITPTLLTNP
jgi:hypothetical protein